MYPYILVSIALALLFAVSCHGAIRKRPGAFYALAILLVVGEVLYYSLGLRATAPQWVNTYVVNLFTRGTLPTALFMVVMYVGALDHRRPLVRKLLAIRGPLSIMACILTLGHNLMYGIRHFVMLFVAPETMRPTTLVAAILSLLMIVLMIPLMVTSFSRVRRRMSAASWKRLQRLAYLFFGLIYAHVMVLFVPQFSHKYLDIILYTAIFGGYLVLRVTKALKVHEQKKASYLRCA